MNTSETSSIVESIRTNPPVNLNPAQAAVYLGISRRTLEKYTKAGDIRAAKFGKRVIYTRAELDRSIALKMASA